MNYKTTIAVWCGVAFLAMFVSSFVGYQVGYRQGDDACRRQLVEMLDVFRVKCHNDLGQVKTEWRELEAAEIKKALPTWIQYEQVKNKLDELGAYGLEGKLYTRNNKRVVFRRKLESSQKELIAEDRREISKLEEDGNYVFLIGKDASWVEKFHE